MSKENDSGISYVQRKRMNTALCFTVTLHDTDNAGITDTVKMHEFALDLLGSTIDYVGTTLFPEYFTRSKTALSPTVDCEGLRLLRTMGEDDCTQEEAMRALNIKPRTAHR